MKKINFQDKYPVFIKKIDKKECKYQNIDLIIEDFKNKIDNHKIATFIATFDNFVHTKSINGEIQDGIISAQNIIFCFGKAIPTTAVLAVRPRSIGVVEYDDCFEIAILEAPNQELQNIMESWIIDIENKAN